MFKTLSKAGLVRHHEDKEGGRRGGGGPKDVVHGWGVGRRHRVAPYGQRLRGVEVVGHEPGAIGHKRG